MIVDPVKFILFVKEAFADSSSVESLIFDMLDFKKVIENDANAVWFLEDIAHEQDEEESMVQEHSGIIEVAGLQYRDAPVIYTTAVGQMTISKDSQGMEAPKSVRVYLGNFSRKLALMCITAYEQILKNQTALKTTNQTNQGKGNRGPACYLGVATKGTQGGQEWAARGIGTGGQGNRSKCPQKRGTSHVKRSQGQGNRGP
ncbi:hypothetical protein MA16_Dca011195 [Dendrobium catenatum]|uniref:Uncharacterized protein n=1 Tax=Dendrobium catenatum TaxID=906689 RepID=A0A2I0VII1_9ASPA|nr:hypothetical protein MA16_Dca011195 [Dendrobium catenatum]